MTLKILFRIHFIALLIAIVNSIFTNLTIYSLQENIAFAIKILAAISGLILFFYYIKSLKKINIYFSIYAIATLLLMIGVIIRGIFGAIIISLILFPISPNPKEYAGDGIIIYAPFRGFMANCCSYQLRERKFLIFEKDNGTFASGEPIDFSTLKIKKTEEEIELTYSTRQSTDIMKKKIKR